MRNIKKRYGKNFVCLFVCFYFNAPKKKPQLMTRAVASMRQDEAVASS